jgi:hypothetical protein
MLRLGFVRLLAVLVFGIALPYGLWRLNRHFGLALMIGAAVALGLAYGALKADNPWSGDGLADNLRLMGVSAFVLAAYVGVSVWAVRVVARSVHSRP